MTPSASIPSTCAGRYHVMVVAPPGLIHSAAFKELAEATAQGLLSLNHTVSADLNRSEPGAVNIIIGAHLLDEAGLAALPASSIIYNTEPAALCGPGAEGMYARLRQAMSRFPAWDYSRRNIQVWRDSGISPRVHYLLPGYAPVLTRIPPAAEQDIDVLFYGSINQRRQHLLLELQRHGVKVCHAFGCFGPQRDQLIARSKLVLNMHFHDEQIFESVRVSYLLANRKAVVAEVNPGTDIDPRLRPAVAAAPYDGLVEVCQQLLADAQARSTQESTGFEQMRQLTMSALLAPLLHSAPAVAQAPLQGR